MKFIVSAFIAGLIFGIGLIISGMTNPAKVQGFLDLAGQWDPSLGLVMAGAIAVGLFAFAAAKKRTTAILGGVMQLPKKSDIDLRLVMGSVVFGIGWGLGGFCPGPALVSLGTGRSDAVVFVLAMLAGMVIFEIAESINRK
jgi:uncharacterized membrane protein YedE/YeeE